MTRNPAFTAIIPSYQRASFLVDCLLDIRNQDFPHEYETVLVCRPDDHATLRLAREESRRGPPRLKVVLVHERGVIHALRAGIEQARGEFIAFCDDDARYPPNWISSLVRHFADRSVGGVGGPICEIPSDRSSGSPQRSTVVNARKTARVSWYGRTEYNVHLRPGFREPILVHLLPGANMAFRSEALNVSDFDPRLGGAGWARGYELHVAFRVRSRGYRLVFDPRVVVEHRSGPKTTGGRTLTPAKTLNYGRNVTFVMLHGLPWSGKLVFLPYFWLIGQWESPGLVVWLVGLMMGRKPHPRWLWTSLKGKWEGTLMALHSA